MLKTYCHPLTEFGFSVKAMLLVIDCKHRLIAKTPQRPLNNGTSKSNRSEKGNKAEKVDLLDEENSTIQIEDPTMPAVSYFHPISFILPN